MKAILRVVSALLTIYLAYWILGALVAPALPARVAEDTKRAFDPQSCYGPAEGPDRVLLVEAPDDAFDKRIQLIDQAEHTLDISYHTVEWGTCAQQFFGAVLDAADRGVQVRFVIDGLIGGINEHQEGVGVALYTHPNIQYVRYNPLDLKRPWLINSRLHDKFIIVDDKLMMLGGRNIGDKYFGPEGFEKNLSYDRDVVIYNTRHGQADASQSALEQVRGYMDQLLALDITRPAYGSLSDKQRQRAESARHEMGAAYDAIRRQRPELFSIPLGNYEGMTLPTNKVTLLHNPPHGKKKEPVLGYQLAALALDAQESVILQSPYTVARKPMRQVFAQVAQQVPRFELLTNSMASSPNIPAFSNYRAMRGRIVDTGVTIYEFQGTDSIHAKTLLLDGRLCAVGSMNMDERSLYLDTETMLVIDSEPLCQQLTAIMGEYQANSLVVGADNRYIDDPAVPAGPVSWVKKLLFGLASIVTVPFGYLI